MKIYKFYVSDDESKIQPREFDDFGGAFDYAQDGLITFIEAIPVIDDQPNYEDSQVVWTWDETYDRDEAIDRVNCMLNGYGCEDCADPEREPENEELQVKVSADKPEELAGLARALFGDNVDFFDSFDDDVVPAAEIEVDPVVEVPQVEEPVDHEIVDPDSAFEDGLYPELFKEPEQVNVPEAEAPQTEIVADHEEEKLEEAKISGFDLDSLLDQLEGEINKLNDKLNDFDKLPEEEKEKIENAKVADSVSKEELDAFKSEYDKFIKNLQKIAGKNESLEEATHNQFAMPDGDKVASYNNALKYAKKYGKPFIYGYTNRRYNGKYFALQQPIKCSDDVANDEAKFRNQYKDCGVVFVAYPDKDFVSEGMDEAWVQVGSGVDGGPIVSLAYRIRKALSMVKDLYIIPREDGTITFVGPKKLVKIVVVLLKSYLDEHEKFDINWEDIKGKYSEGSFEFTVDFNAPKKQVEPEQPVEEIPAEVPAEVPAEEPIEEKLEEKKNVTYTTGDPALNAAHFNGEAQGGGDCCEALEDEQVECIWCLNPVNKSECVHDKEYGYICKDCLPEVEKLGNKLHLEDDMSDEEFVEAFGKAMINKEENK